MTTVVASFARDVVDLQVQIDAIGLGAVYALMAVGIGLVFGVLRLVNFAYGQLIMAGAFALALASEWDWPVWAGIVLVALSLVVGYAIVFASGFDPQQPRSHRRGSFQRPITETSLAYLVSLVVATGALFLTQNVSPEDPLGYILEQTLVLGLPATVGGAAGRLAI